MSAYTEGKKVIEPDARFKHVMAITLDPYLNYQEGIIRCITSREGNVQFRGYRDRSQLYKLKGKSLEEFTITDPLVIKNQEDILKPLIGEDDFIGLEDPDIWRDENTGLMHVYFTIPIDPLDKGESMRIHLGHAVGEDLDSLEMTEPVLIANSNYIAKEVSIAPLNSRGFRYNLVESRDHRSNNRYSTVQVVITEDMSKLWRYGETVFHPAEHNLSWIARDASPGPLFPTSFIDIGEGRRVGVMNGREAGEKMPDGTIKYRHFSIGLFIYNYENGKIEWVSPERLIMDSEAVTVTFASHFVETEPGKGILYGHVDDSFVRAYTLNAEGIKKLIPTNFL